MQFQKFFLSILLTVPIELYFSEIYRRWRSFVFRRDDYTCQTCNKKGGEIQADHIKPWAFYPDLRFSVDNGRTLCKDCHRKTDTWGVWGGRKDYAKI